LPELWKYIPNTNQQEHQLVNSLMNVLMTAQSIKNKSSKDKTGRKKIPAVDPLKFLTAFQASFREYQNSAEFVWSTPQDASEVLEHLLHEVGSLAGEAFNRIGVDVVSTVSCDTCLESSVSEEKHALISVPITSAKSVLMSVQEYLKLESLTGDNQWFCINCNGKRDATKSLHFANAPVVLIVHLKRFSHHLDGSLHKSVARVDVDRSIRLLVKEQRDNSEVSFFQSYKLRACISHIGSLTSGHYVAHVKSGNQWYKCNDAAVTESTLKMVKVDAYILFFVRT
jgi:ubiquitin C-terminal hydrolase